MYQFRLDYQSSAVFVKNAGFWTPVEADAYVTAFGNNVDLMRKSRGRVRILVDAREAAIHAVETVQRIALFRQHVDNALDRVAVVVATSLKKQQVTRTMPPCAKAFLSMDAANLWLFAHDHCEVKPTLVA